MSPRDNIKRLILQHRGRLQILQEQEAQQGLSVDPKIPLEIIRIKDKIATLEEELLTASDEDETIPPFQPSAPTSDPEPAAGQFPASGGVQIGNVGGDIKDSIIAGRDVSHVTMTRSEHHGVVEPEPTKEVLKRLLVEIQQELTALKAEQEVLKAISLLGPRKVENAQECIKEATEVAGSTHADGEVLLEYLEGASDAVGNILEKTNKKIETLGSDVRPVTKQLGALLKKLAMAAAWAAKLYMLS